MMQITENTVVSLRYSMKNSKGEIVENILEGAPVSYLHGAGNILPGLEADLAGLQAGDKKSVFVVKGQGGSSLDDDFYFEVIIDDIRWGTEEERRKGHPTQPSHPDDCGPGCCC